MENFLKEQDHISALWKQQVIEHSPNFYFQEHSLSISSEADTSSYFKFGFLAIVHANRLVPFDVVADEIESRCGLQRSEIVQVLFGLKQEGNLEETIGDVSVTKMNLEETIVVIPYTGLELECIITEKEEGMTGSISFSSHETVETLVQHLANDYVSYLHAVCNDSDLRLST